MVEKHTISETFEESTWTNQKKDAAETSPDGKSEQNFPVSLVTHVYKNLHSFLEYRNVNQKSAYLRV